MSTESGVPCSSLNCSSEMATAAARGGRRQPRRPGDKNDVAPCQTDAPQQNNMIGGVEGVRGRRSLPVAEVDSGGRRRNGEVD